MGVVAAPLETSASVVVVVAKATVVGGLVPLTDSVEVTATIGVMVEGTVG